MKSEKKEQPGNINWYPGHMKKTRELIASNLKMVDAVIEVADARIPVSSRNPILAELTERKPRILILSKADLADPVQNKVWAERLEKEGLDVIAADCRTGKGIDRIFRALQNLQDKRDAETARKRPVRLMIVGVPNAGKSSLINRLTGKKSAQVGNRPGVTRGKQWLTLKNGMQLLDTPGILWPKFEDPNVGLNLAFCGSIKDDILGVQDLGFELIKYLGAEYPEMMKERYKLDEVSEDALENMDNIALKRGFILSGKRIDYERTGRIVLDEFRGGMIGRITLEKIK